MSSKWFRCLVWPGAKTHFPTKYGEGNGTPSILAFLHRSDIFQRPGITVKHISKQPDLENDLSYFQKGMSMQNLFQSVLFRYIVFFTKLKVKAH